MSFEDWLVDAVVGMTHERSAKMTREQSAKVHGIRYPVKYFDIEQRIHFQGVSNAHRL
jgi:hypothetical protein